jgi:hypothetical protein
MSTSTTPRTTTSTTADTTTSATPGTTTAARTWASELTGPAAPDAVTPARGRGALGLATAMVAGPLAMTGWFLVEPAVLPREEPSLFLGSVASAPDR